MARRSSPSSHLLAFGERLRELRVERGLSQEALAHKARMHRTYLGSVERGERNVALVNIYALAKALEVDVKQLFDDTSRPGHYPTSDTHSL